MFLLLSWLINSKHNLLISYYDTLEDIGQPLITELFFPLSSQYVESNCVELNSQCLPDDCVDTVFQFTLLGAKIFVFLKLNRL